MDKVLEYLEECQKHYNELKKLVKECHEASIKAAELAEEASKIYLQLREFELKLRNKRYFMEGK